MVLASHVIVSAYGFWLPNDPRGSWSTFVRKWELVRFGRATKTDSRRSVAQDPRDRNRRLAARRALRSPPVRFTGVQARAIGRGFEQFTERSGVTTWACAILPEHVHLVVARHRYHVEQVVSHLKGDATRRLVEEEIHPFAAIQTPKGRPPSVWGCGRWKVFLNDPLAIRRAIAYVQANPGKEGKPSQTWAFVTRYG